jgi:hemoglobin
MALMGGHFECCRALFEATTRAVSESDFAEFFIDRAHRIADSLQIGISIGPKALHLPSRAVGDGVRG